MQVDGCNKAKDDYLTALLGGMGGIWILLTNNQLNDTNISAQAHQAT